MVLRCDPEAARQSPGRGAARSRAVDRAERQPSAVSLAAAAGSRIVRPAASASAGSMTISASSSWASTRRPSRSRSTRSPGAHRSLSDLYLGEPRLESARVSELLQSQLLHPSAANLSSPALRSRISTSSDQSARRGHLQRVHAAVSAGRLAIRAPTGIAGTDQTLGGEASASLLKGRSSISAAQFHYQTDGFRKNFDIQHDIFAVTGQFQATEALQLQTEYRRRKSEFGESIAATRPRYLQ